MSSNTTGGRPAKLFYSYSHKDEALREELEDHLALLRRNKIIEGWKDRDINASTELADEISRHLDDADVILLLISASFISSDYCYSIEMERAMQRHKEGTARVVPIILRPCDWKDAPFSKLLALPRDARPVTSWPDRQEAFLDVATGIRRLVASLNLT